MGIARPIVFNPNLHAGCQTKQSSASSVALLRIADAVRFMNTDYCFWVFNLFVVFNWAISVANELPYVSDN